MNLTHLALLNGWEMIMILAVVLVLFGPKKLPELAKGLGKGINEFKKASREVTEELHNAMEAETQAPAPRPARPAAPAPAPAAVAKTEPAPTAAHETVKPS